MVLYVFDHHLAYCIYIFDRHLVYCIYIFDDHIASCIYIFDHHLSYCTWALFESGPAVERAKKSPEFRVSFLLKLPSVMSHKGRVV